MVEKFEMENLTKIQVVGLLDPGNNFEIEIRRVIILHGYNGCGKTTLLKCIQFLLNGDYQKSLEYKFERISFVFEDDRKLSFTLKSDENLSLECAIYSKNGEKEYESVLKENAIIAKLDFSHFRSDMDFRAILNSLPNIESRDNDDNFPYVDKDTGEIIREPDEAYEYLNNKKLKTFDETIRQYLSNLNSFFIQTNRLESIDSIMGTQFQDEDELREYYYRPTGRIVRRRPNFSKSDPLSIIQQRIKDEIDRVSRESARIGREFDSRFFDLLIDETKNVHVNEFDLRLKTLEEKLKKIDLKEQELKKLGLYEGPTAEIERAKRILNEEKDTIDQLLNASVVFSQALEEKFKVYNDLSYKIAKFTKFIKDHFKKKELEINKESGFIFHKGNNIIQTKDLSSGEKHIILLAFFLVFIAPEKSLVLIDEPEISLHLEWQEKLIDDFLELTDDSELRFIIATHSPGIISHYRDFMVLLEN